MQQSTKRKLKATFFCIAHSAQYTSHNDHGSEKLMFGTVVSYVELWMHFGFSNSICTNIARVRWSTPNYRNVAFKV